MENNNYSKQIFYILFFIGIVVLAFALKTLTSVLLPVIFAVVISLVFYPLVKKMNQKLHCPWTLASVLVTILTVFIALAASSLVVTSLTSILSQYPKYEDRFFSIYKKIAEQFNLTIDENKSLIQNVLNFSKIKNLIQNFVLNLSQGLVSFGKSFLLIFILMSFLLFEMKFADEKIKSAFSSNNEKVLNAIKNTVNKITAFLSIKFFISLATGILVFVSAIFLKMDFPIVWGFLAFIMNFIPTFGSIISTIFTVLFAFIQFYPSLWQTITILLLMLSINMILGNILEPKIEGEDLGLSPFVILVSLSLWGYIWGFMGLLLAVPMTVILKVVCENIPQLNFIAVFLGNSGKTKSKLKKYKKNKSFQLPENKNNPEEQHEK
ncbi:MAG: AI-2E family transporter [Treponema sp.]|nr:AI-2E family transporter [Treponema sp.]